MARTTSKITQLPGRQGIISLKENGVAFVKIPFLTVRAALALANVVRPRLNTKTQEKKPKAENPTFKQWAYFGAVGGVIYGVKEIFEEDISESAVVAEEKRSIQPSSAKQEQAIEKQKSVESKEENVQGLVKVEENEVSPKVHKGLYPSDIAILGLASAVLLTVGKLLSD